MAASTDLAVADILGPEGSIARRLEHYEQRPEQLAMADAMRHATRAGRLAYMAGRIPKRLYATASSPEDGVITGKPR